MVNAPGAAMLDQKVFIVRTDGHWPDLFERWWDGEEWLWVNHGRPEGMPLRFAPGAAMMDEKLFVVSQDGRLWERHWRKDLGRWAWSDHGRPNNLPIIATPGAAMMNEKLFVTAQYGELWERHWRPDLGRWAWENHGRPGGEAIAHAPGAAMMNEKLFVVTTYGKMWERHWRKDLGQWVWADHGAPLGTSLTTAPGAAMMDRKLFAGGKNGHLYERYWDDTQWIWVDHGAPPTTSVGSEPGAAMLDRSVFVRGADGQLYERWWDGTAWVWIGHGAPPSSSLTTAPGGAMLNRKLFIGAGGRMFERYWTGSRWAWIDHGTPLHDQAMHLVDNRGGGPKRNLAIVAEGFAEPDLNTFRGFVQREIVDGTFGRDLYVEIRPGFNIVRVDLVSIDSGVSTRTYDEKGTASDASDDTIMKESTVNTRLGYSFSGSWAHCWAEPAPDTNKRLVKILGRFVPDWDFALIVLNNGGWGGCRRDNQLVVTRGVDWAVVAHELGHGLGNLDDEYDREGLTYSAPAYPSVNCSRVADRKQLPWADLVDTATPLPTDEQHPPSGWDGNRSVGAFEGCGTYEKGLFRPALECRMNQNTPPFCPVCARHMRTVHAMYL